MRLPRFVRPLRAKKRDASPSRVQGRKAVIFTFMALLAVGLLFVLLRPDQPEINLQKAQVARARVQLADEYVRSIRETYLPRMVYVSSYRSLNALAVYVGNRTSAPANHKFFATEAEFQAAFKEVLLNGTYQRVHINNLSMKDLYGKNLSVQLANLSNISNEFLFMDTRFDIANTKVDVYQDNETGPWRIAVNLSMRYLVNASLASWAREDDIIVYVSIEGLEDPLYRGSTAGRFGRQVRSTNTTGWTNKTFQSLVNQSRYAFDRTAPGYLQRFYNDTAPSPDTCCGIESFVTPDIEHFFPPSPASEEPSFVDCAYFGGRCVSLLPAPQRVAYNVTPFTNSTYRFKLDQYRVFGKYNVSQDAYT